MEAVGIDRWPHFVADAQERARDPATQDAIEKSRQPPGPSGKPSGFPRGRDVTRPVYPVETLLGVGAVAAKGAAAAARALAGTGLRQAMPESRPSTGNAASNTAKPENPAGNAGRQAESIPSDRPVRLHKGQQEKHIEGSNNPKSRGPQWNYNCFPRLNMILDGHLHSFPIPLRLSPQGRCSPTTTRLTSRGLKPSPSKTLRGGLVRHALFSQQGLQFAGLIHFRHNVTTADELALYVKLGYGWPA